MLKDGLTGSRVAWTHTSSDGSVSVSAEKGLEGLESVDGDEGENGLEEKPGRVSGGGGGGGGSRRQRSSSGGVVVGNPDLLAIPGVGPRNLRKLVEKGIGGVAELKQLYKDKVYWVCMNYENGCIFFSRIENALCCFL